MVTYFDMIAYNEIKKYSQEISDELIKAIDILRSEGAKRIILFGSLASNRFRQHSDIDLACEGLEDERFFHIYGKLMFNLTIPLDLIDINDADDFFASRVRKEGIVLYEE